MAAGERLGQLRHPVRGSAADQARHHRPTSTSRSPLRAKGEPCGLFFKTNTVTDKDIIVKIAEASQAGVPVTLLVRGISCLVPGRRPATPTTCAWCPSWAVCLEHSRIYGFGPRENIKIYLSSADLMTRNMEKRVEIAWPILDKGLRNQVLRLHRHVPARHGEAARVEGRRNLYQARRAGRARRAEVRIAGLPHQGGSGAPARRLPRPKPHAMQTPASS